MYLSSLRAVGGSVMLAIPKSVLESLNLAPNAKVGLSIHDGRLVMEPRAKPRYTLAELVAQCDPNAPPDNDLMDWQESGPEGREVI